MPIPCALIVFIATSTSLLVAGNLTLVSEYVNIQKLNLTSRGVAQASGRPSL